MGNFGEAVAIISQNVQKRESSRKTSYAPSSYGNLKLSLYSGECSGHDDGRGAGVRDPGVDHRKAALRSG